MPDNHILVKGARQHNLKNIDVEIPRDEVVRLIKDLEAQMKQAAKALEFEKAALLRDQILELRRSIA